MPTQSSKSNPGKASGRWITTLEGYRVFHPSPVAAAAGLDFGTGYRAGGLVHARWPENIWRD